MPLLRDTRSGVVVSVDDATAALLGRAYAPVDEPKPAPRKPARKRPAKKPADAKE